MRTRSIVLGVALLCAALAGPPPVGAQIDGCFVETGFCIDDRLLSFWQSNGGVMVFGLPLTQAREETNPDTGRPVLTQWFERNRLELHVDAPLPYRLQLGRLGAESIERLIAAPEEGKPPAQPQKDCLWFAQTNHNLCDQPAGHGFRSYWQAHGVEVDGKSGIGFADSLALFGFPLTEVAQATNSSGDSVLTQWFERARFEWHPQNRAPERVLLGRLGAEVLGLPQAGASGIAGMIMAGPTCPVEQPGVDCPDHPLQATVRVEYAANGRLVTEFSSDQNGRFHVQLAPDRYRLVPLPPNGAVLPRGEPLDVEVPPGRFVIVTILYDTGIR